MAEPKTIRWGIMATGGIATTFARDLLLDPSTRGVHDIKHTIVAVGSSSGEDKSRKFLEKIQGPASAKAYGNYQDFVNDDSIDVVYIATPHSHHYQNARLALEAGRNVLCEKAFTVNAAQAKILVDLAKKKNLFLMEALWTRYLPLSKYCRDLVTSGTLGNVTRTIADISEGFDPENTFADGTSRYVKKDLAGGAILDLGIYALTWCFQTLYTVQDEKERTKPTVIATMKEYPPTGVDEAVNMVLTFPRSRERGGDAMGIALASWRSPPDPDGKGSAGPSIRIQGDKGEVQIWYPGYRPYRTRLVLLDGTVEDKEWPQPGPGPGSGWFTGVFPNHDKEGEGHGMFWEADEVAYALLEGRKEGRAQTLEESLTIMEIMDEARRQGGLKYSDKIETVEYPEPL